jgi:hypothetical protein
MKNRAHLGRGRARAKRRRRQRAALMRELLRPGTRVRALEQSTLVAQLEYPSYSLAHKQKKIGKGRTTLPGLKLLLLHVLVSVVQQLKHRLRTRSLSFIAASSVCITGIPPTPAPPAPASPCDICGALNTVPGSGYGTYGPCVMWNGCGAYEWAYPCAWPWSSGCGCGGGWYGAGGGGGAYMYPW